MIYAIVNPHLPEIGYQRITFGQAWSILSKQRELEFDIETPVTESVAERKATVYSFGIPCGGDQFVFDLKYVTPSQIAMLNSIIESTSVTKLIHNAAFEYMTLYTSGIIMENVYDTMLGEMILDSGNNTVSYSLDDTVYRRFFVIISKMLQKSFADGIVSTDQIEYAATDVAWLGFIRRQQMLGYHQWDLEWVAALEMEAVLGYAEITAEGIQLDKDKWIENEQLAEPVVAESLRRLNAWVQEEPFRSWFIKNNYLLTEDKCVINWNSHPTVRALFAHYFPFLKGATQPILKQYIKSTLEEFPEGTLGTYILTAYIEKRYEVVLEYFLKKDYNFMYAQAYMLPAGHISINWNSVDQVLPLGQLLHPKLKSLDADNIAKTSHPFFIDLTDYKDALKLISTYGQAFFKHVDSDGKVHSKFTQIVSTGRVSSKDPNMQNIPAKKAVGLRYRNAFIPHDPNWDMVDSDYASQELVAIAELSKDPVWLKALQEGRDLHSVCAELVFKDKWKNAQDTTCHYYEKQWRHIVDNTWLSMDEYQARHQPSGYVYEVRKGKCKCKRHGVLREGIKSINFGLAYGMSEFKLAATMRTSVPEAKALIDQYFREFPSIKSVLNYFEWFGITYGYIMTPAPFFRKRWFPDWQKYNLSYYAEEHLMGVRRDNKLAEIGRQSKNAPIQGGSADSAKLSLVMIRMYINDNKLRDRVKLVMQVHDQNTTSARRDYAPQWSNELTSIMIEAGKWLVPSGLLGCETTVSPVWTK